ncbi:hypothetical protein F4808DRAFT_357538 [Astrocystis sublimbata]|nr:hypothetical protein F4808DRAFT_357538 [Astrocystis sublimbata]
MRNPNSLPPWPRPEDSIGRQIPSSRIKGRIAWWPRGPAYAIFEDIIVSEIKDTLKAVDLGHADLFIRLYMIGRKPESANPLVMICCTDPGVRETAVNAIRDNGLLDRHRGFGLGGAALPLEHPLPVRRLSPHGPPPTPPPPPPGPLLPPSETNPLPFIIIQLPKFSYNARVDSMVFSSSYVPTIGRRIYGSYDIRQAAHPCATAGVVIQVDHEYYQLTVGHLFEAVSWISTSEHLSMMSLDECYFDGQDSDDNDNLEWEEETDMSGGSLPSPSRSSNEEIPQDYDTNVLGVSNPTFNTVDGSKKLSIGYRPYEDFTSSIDYAMISIPQKSAVIYTGQNINRVMLSENLYIEDVDEVGDGPRSIIVVTQGRLITGILTPEKIAYRNFRAQFESLFQVTLERELFEGDSGSPVLDKLTGSLYGHIAMGVPGTKVAYIVSAIEIFRDIEHAFAKPVRLYVKGDKKQKRIRTDPIDQQTLKSISTGQPSFSPGSHSNTGFSQFSQRPATLATSKRDKTRQPGFSPLPPFSVAGAPTDSQSSSTSTRLSKNPNTQPNVSSMVGHNENKTQNENKTRQPSFISTESYQSRRTSNFSYISVEPMLAPASAPAMHTTGSRFPSRSLPCEFVSMGCNKRFELDDVDGWIDHVVFDHLGNKLPKKVACWFCDTLTFDYHNSGNDRRSNFESRMWHIRDHILVDGFGDHDIRPDHFFMEHLEKHEIVSEQAYYYTRQYSEVPQGDWIIPHEAVPKEWEQQERGECEYYDPQKDKRKDRRRKYISGSDRK